MYTVSVPLHIFSVRKEILADCGLEMNYKCFDPDQLRLSTLCTTEYSELGDDLC